MPAYHGEARTKRKRRARDPINPAVSEDKRRPISHLKTSENKTEAEIKEPYDTGASDEDRTGESIVAKDPTRNSSQSPPERTRSSKDGNFGKQHHVPLRDGRLASTLLPPDMGDYITEGGRCEVLQEVITLLRVVQSMTEQVVATLPNIVRRCERVLEVKGSKLLEKSEVIVTRQNAPRTLHHCANTGTYK